MKRLYAVFLLVVAIYFLVAPQGAVHEPRRAQAGDQSARVNSE